MKYLLALVICAVSCAAQAAPPAPSPSKLAKLHELMEINHFSESIAQYRAVCLKQYQTGIYTPDKVAQEKGNYRSFKPGTPEWPKVLAAYEVYSEQSCSYYDQDRIAQAYIQFYDSRLSESDLDAYLAFEKSPAGQHMTAVGLDAEKYFSGVYRELGEPVLKAAGDQFATALRDICDDESWFEKLSCNP